MWGHQQGTSPRKTGESADHEQEYYITRFLKINMFRYWKARDFYEF
nr:MAG TPA: hypothetical protein [Caudoviricetes sp.]